MTTTASSGSRGATRDEFFAALADTRRRTVLRVVTRQSPDGIEKADLARQLAAVSLDDRPSEVSDDDHQQALVDLHHRLVPALTDIGLLEETDDGTITLGTHPAGEDLRLEEVVSTHHDADDATLDAVFRAIADERRRTIMSILADENRPLEIEPLARRVAVREAGTTEREVARDRIDDVRTTLVHVHVPMLADATLVEYDAETGRVAYTGQSVVAPEWLRPDGGDTATATDEPVTVERCEDRSTPATHELIYRAQPRSP